MYGTPSDPYKMAAMRIIMREYEKYMHWHQLEDNNYNNTSVYLDNFFRYAIKLTEQ